MPTRIDLPDKSCLKCGVAFNRGRLPSGRLEEIKDFQVRKFCSQTCYWDYNTGNNHFAYKPEGSIRPDGYVRISVKGERKYLHRILVESNLETILSANEHVHHKDKNPSNNSKDNLEVKSKYEHSKLHAQERSRNSKGQFHSFN
jgi:hypothetical protein